MHEEDGGVAAEGTTENRPVEKAAADSAAELSVISNPVKTSIPKEPAFPHGKRTTTESSTAQFADAVLDGAGSTEILQILVKTLTERRWSFICVSPS